MVLQELGPARLLSSCSREDGQVLVSFSTVFVVAVEVVGDRGLEVEAPPRWIDSPTWKIKNVEPATVTPHGEGRRWRQTFVLDPTAPAVDALELKPLHYRNADGRWQTIDKWKPIAVKIVVQVPSPESKTMREHPTIEDLPRPPAEFAWDWLLAVGSLAGCVILLLLVTFVLRRRADHSARTRTFADVAIHELTRLDDMALPDKGRTGEFHTLLANVVRRYLEKRYQFPARRLTTQEFSPLLEETTLLTEAQKEFLRKFLCQCDLAKFAEAQVGVQVCRELLRQTREFLTSSLAAQRAESQAGT